MPIYHLFPGKVNQGSPKSFNALREIKIYPFFAPRPPPPQFLINYHMWNVLYVITGMYTCIVHVHT